MTAATSATTTSDDEPMRPLSGARARPRPDATRSRPRRRSAVLPDRRPSRRARDRRTSTPCHTCSTASRSSRWRRSSAWVVASRWRQMPLSPSPRSAAISAVGVSSAGSRRGTSVRSSPTASSQSIATRRSTTSFARRPETWSAGASSSARVGGEAPTKRRAISIMIRSASSSRDAWLASGLNISWRYVPRFCQANASSAPSSTMNHER